jgi:hypothetical protein
MIHSEREYPQRNALLEHCEQEPPDATPWDHPKPAQLAYCAGLTSGITEQPLFLHHFL